VHDAPGCSLFLEGDFEIAPMQLLICSDIHYASEAEKRRIGYELAAIPNPLQRLLVRYYRHYFWLRDPFAHNALLDRVLNAPIEPDLAIANGDYSCDSAFIGVADPAARQSALECLGKLKSRFGNKFRAVFGDHELGKKSLCAGRGGLRLESFDIAQRELNLQPIWSERVGRYVLVAVTSSLAAMPVYEKEALEEERSRWRELANDHCARVQALFEKIRPNETILLFCHDPTALPFLAKVPAVTERIDQIERTVIGHLHSELILKQSRLFSWIPPINGCGATTARISAALSKSREWRRFNVLLCPSLSGLELTRRGGFYTAHVDPDAQSKARFELHEIRR
jgi:hypothetical protein